MTLQDGTDIGREDAVKGVFNVGTRGCDFC